MNEAELARAIATGAAESPTRIGGSVLVALRCSGTGLAQRATEKVFRDKNIWLSPATVDRVRGLAVVLDHPVAALDGEQYALRSVGSVLLGYVAGRDGFENPDGPDLWAIARLFVGPMAMAELARGSTSPAVTFAPGSGNQTITLPSGEVCLVETTPDDIEHLALVTMDEGGGAGVWDLGDPNQRGIRIDTTEQAVMDDDETMADKKADAAAEGPPAWAQAMMDSMAGIGRRMDAYEAARADAAKDSEKSEKEDEDDDKDGKEAKRREDSAYHYQAIAERASEAWGQRAPAPLSGERVLGYRKRLLGFHKQHSPMFADADFDILAKDAVSFDKIEAQVYADSIRASANPKGPDDGRMISRKKTTESGHTVTEWFGQKTVFELFSSPPMYATAFLTPQQRGY